MPDSNEGEKSNEILHSEDDFDSQLQIQAALLLNKSEQNNQRRVIKDKQEYKQWFNEALDLGKPKEGGETGQHPVSFTLQRKTSGNGEQSLRARTLTPSKTVNVAQEEIHDYSHPKFDVKQDSSIMMIGGLTAENLEQLDIANHHILVH